MKVEIEVNDLADLVGNSKLYAYYSKKITDITAVVKSFEGSNNMPAGIEEIKKIIERF